MAEQQAGGRGAQGPTRGDLSARKIDPDVLAEARRIVREAGGAGAASLIVGIEHSTDGEPRITVTASGYWHGEKTLGATVEVTDTELLDAARKLIERITQRHGEEAHELFAEHVYATRAYARNEGEIE